LLIMLPVTMREIIEEHRFADELAQIIDDVRRADEFIDGAKWLLSRAPKSGTQIGSSNVWFLPMKEVPAIMPVIMYYTFDEHFVNFLSIQETIYPVKE
jgi:hypothetical protein